MKKSSLKPVVRHPWRPLPRDYRSGCSNGTHHTIALPDKVVVWVYVNGCHGDTAAMVSHSRSIANELNAKPPKEPDHGYFVCTVPSGAIHAVEGYVMKDEDPRDCARRLVLERMDLISGDVVLCHAYVPDERIDSIVYTFVAYDPVLAAHQREPKVVREIVPMCDLIAAPFGTQPFVGDVTFLLLLRDMHGHFDHALLEQNFSGRSAYSVLDTDCLDFWKRYVTCRFNE